jgi:hypothetical protein
MALEADPVDFLERKPDLRLLEEEAGHLPASVGLPEPVPPPSVLRRRLVGVGAALTGLSLLVGVALLAAGIAQALSDAAVLAIAAFAVGAALIGTHWGWVHVAEWSVNRLEGRRQEEALAGRLKWLQAVEPYPRWEVSTDAGEDGSITIVTVCHRPVIRDERTYTFVRQEVGREAHSAEEPAAAVTERAESLRRLAAAETRRAREDYEAAREAYEHTLLARDDEQQRLAALRAASRALSERINSNLREPPLIE